MSSIGWIDFSSEHREKVRTVIDLLSASEVVDKLGEFTGGRGLYQSSGFVHIDTRASNADLEG